MGEAVRAFTRLGAPHHFLTFPEGAADVEDVVRSLNEAIDAFRPDFALTVNHLGLDREGLTAGILARRGVPLASWFVDAPELILPLYAPPRPDLTAVFVWDADAVAPLRAAGLPHVRHLPLAADETRFKPAPPPPSGHPWRAEVSFVGNSMVIKTRSRLAFANPPEPLALAFHDLGRDFGQSPERRVGDFLRRARPDLAPAFEAMPSLERRLALETALIWEATRQYRQECLARLMPFAPLIVGDPGWLETFGQEGVAWRRVPELAYYDELPRFYPASLVNFNATSRQMKGAVNQRVFDVPAAGAFLLTDRRRQMEDLFEPGREMAVYDHPDDIPGLVRHYLDHPEERRRLVAAGRRRVLADHTYPRRMSQLIGHMRDIFGG